MMPHVISLSFTLGVAIPPCKMQQHTQSHKHKRCVLLQSDVHRQPLAPSGSVEWFERRLKPFVSHAKAASQPSKPYMACKLETHPQATRATRVPVAGHGTFTTPLALLSRSSRAEATMDARWYQ